MGRFFTVDFESRSDFRRALPFYESSKECNEGSLITVLLPQNRFMLGKLGN